MLHRESAAEVHAAVLGSAFISVGISAIMSVRQQRLRGGRGLRLGFGVAVPHEQPDEEEEDMLDLA